MNMKPIIYTIEENLDFFEQIGMVKNTSENKTIYTFNPQYGEGYIKITNNICNYYFSAIEYSVKAGYEVCQYISERYVTIVMLETGKNVFVKWNDELKTPPMPMGVSFNVNISGTKDWMYCPPQTYCKGYGIILRETFIKEQLAGVTFEKFGEDAEIFDIIKRAGNKCLPALSQVMVFLKNCNYKNKAYNIILDAKIGEIIAALIDAIENMSESDVFYLNDYDRNAIHSAKEILESNIILPPTVKMLSRQVGLNINKLQLGFKLLYGVTVMEYLRGFRMEKSLDFLSQYVSVSEVAKSVGYKSTSRFSETFYSKYNLTPSQYRKFL